MNIAAVRVCGRNAHTMEGGTPVACVWNPDVEANPRVFQRTGSEKE